MSRKKRLILTVTITAALAFGGAVPAFADVHGVSQAQCGLASQSGATVSRDAPGRPDAPIPTNASGATRGSGGAAPAMGTNC